MKDTDNLISIRILDRHYQIKCPAEEAQELQESAQYVDQQMRKMRQNGGTTSTDRIAVVVALNTCHELMLLKKQQNQLTDNMSDRITELQNKIENFLDAEEKVLA